MRRLPVLCVAFLVAMTVAASPAAAVVDARLTGTWIVSQSLNAPETLPTDRAEPLAPLEIVDLIHMDPDLEVRTLSGFFPEGGCDLAAKSAVALPVRASPGVGDWTFGEDLSVSMYAFHYIYDCAGRALGYVVVRRSGLPLYAFSSDPKGPEDPNNPPGGGHDDYDFVGWEGEARLQFFNLKGEPLAVPMEGVEGGVTELSGPFRAQRATGEPAR